MLLDHSVNRQIVPWTVRRSREVSKNELDKESDSSCLSFSQLTILTGSDDRRPPMALNPTVMLPEVGCIAA
eukprot:1557973-Rhodomonas_salina.4